MSRKSIQFSDTKIACDDAFYDQSGHSAGSVPARWYPVWCNPLAEPFPTDQNRELRRRLITWMKNGAVSAATAILGATAVAVAPMTNADDFSGTYRFNAPAQGYSTGFSTTWTVTPCGDGCVHITTASGGTDTDAHLEGPYWVFFRYADPGVNCGTDPATLNPRILPALMRYTVNPQTLMGQFQPDGTPCGAVSMPRSEEHTSELQSRLNLVC